MACEKADYLRRTVSEECTAAPELLPTAGGDFGEAKATFAETLDRLVAAGEDPEFRWAPHAAFGRLTPADWGALIDKHIEHHWKQFGI